MQALVGCYRASDQRLRVEGNRFRAKTGDGIEQQPGAMLEAQFRQPGHIVQAAGRGFMVHRSQVGKLAAGQQLFNAIEIDSLYLLS